MKSLVNNWARNDPTGAGQFLGGLPAGNSRVSAVQAYIIEVCLTSPELAGPFVNQIPDENQRFSSAQMLAPNFQRSDPAGYAKWLAALNLPEEKLKLLPK